MITDLVEGYTSCGIFIQSIVKSFYNLTSKSVNDISVSSGMNGLNYIDSTCHF
jgi:hypothetical protein